MVGLIYDLDHDPTADRHDAMTWEDGDYTAEQAERDAFDDWWSEQGAEQHPWEHDPSGTMARHASDDDQPF